MASATAASAEGEPALREFVAAKPDLAELAALADLEKVSVLSYNLLSQMGARRLQRGGKSYVDAAILNIKQRRELLLREMLSYDADVMCLQEVDDYDDWWAAQLATAGYDSVYASSSSQYSEIGEGLVTAFRKETFQLFRSSEVHLNDLCDDIADPNLAAKARQDNLALLLCLQPWESSTLPSALCVANTQFASAPTTEMERVRVLQAEYLCRQIAVFNADFQLPIVLAGTFNATPSSDVYHVILTGRRRPVPEAPRAPGRPRVEEPTPSSLKVVWEPPPLSTTSLTPTAPVLEYKLAIKNCSSRSMGFMHEVSVADGQATSFIVSSLSADMTYQFRVMARNAHGWGHWSQPSVPETTLEPLVAKKKLYGKLHDEAKPLYIARDQPEPVKPYAPSFGSGRTPRYCPNEHTEAKTEINLAVCPRALLSAVPGSIGGSDQRVEAKRYLTLQPRADRDDQIVHGEQMESAYASYAQYLSEPEFTFSSDKFQGTIDYIFHSSGQLAPFQLLALPSLEELEASGQDARQPSCVQDVEWAKHKPEDWHDTMDKADYRETERYMGLWCAPELPDVVGRTSSWLPNANCPSDHLPLACVFAVRHKSLAVAWN